MSAKTQVVNSKLSLLSLSHHHIEAMRHNEPCLGATARATWPDITVTNIIRVATTCMELEAQASRLTLPLDVTKSRARRQVGLDEWSVEDLEDHVPHVHDKVAQSLAKLRAGEGALSEDVLHSVPKLREFGGNLLQLEHYEPDLPLARGGQPQLVKPFTKIVCRHDHVGADELCGILLGSFRATPRPTIGPLSRTENGR
jgi:hypothetical protein